MIETCVQYSPERIATVEDFANCIEFMLGLKDGSSGELACSTNLYLVRIVPLYGRRSQCPLLPGAEGDDMDAKAASDRLMTLNPKTLHIYFVALLKGSLEQKCIYTAGAGLVCRSRA